MSATTHYGESEPTTQETDTYSALRVPNEYRQTMRDALARHTDSPEIYLTADQEQHLANQIQNGLLAQELLNEQPQSTDISLLQEQIQTGQHAEQTLVECNLQLSCALAYASMGGKHWRTTESYPDRRALWKPKKIGYLHSPHAIPEDRVQIANIGLLYAARQYIPGYVGKNGQPTRFSTYASKIIETHLLNYIIGASNLQHELPIHIPSKKLRQIHQAQQDDWPSLFTPAERKELLMYGLYNDLIPFDELYFSGLTDTGYDNDMPPPLLAAHEVLADTCPGRRDAAQEVIQSDNTNKTVHDQLSKTIKEAFTNLTDRECHILTMRFGLSGAQKHTYASIGTQLGITHQGAQQAANVAILKLRDSPALQILNDFYDESGIDSTPEHTTQRPIFTRRKVGGATLRAVTAKPGSSPKSIT